MKEEGLLKDRRTEEGITLVVIRKEKPEGERRKREVE